MTSTSDRDSPSAHSRTSATVDRRIHAAAAHYVAAAVVGTAHPLDDPLGDLAERQVMGVYVSLKRNGQLRGCCGFTGQAQTLRKGIAFAAEQTARHDPRMPPVSPSELPFLDLEVWLLEGLIPVQVAPAERPQAIRVGRDGLLIAHQERRGLLLPGVAVEHQFDERTFLEQVCRKAKLPTDSWQRADTSLHRFEGQSVSGPFPPEVTQQYATPASTDWKTTELAQFCTQNVTLMRQGALPNYYATGLPDGMVSGVVLSPQGNHPQMARISLRKTFPLQATLFELSQQLARQLSAAHPHVIVDVGVLHDPAMHGTTQTLDLRGMDTEQRAVLLTSSRGSAWRWDPATEAKRIVAQLTSELDAGADRPAAVYSLQTQSSRVPIQFVSRPAATAPHVPTAKDVRPPAVAGTFYPASPEKLRQELDTLLPHRQARQAWRAAMVPHAGLRYSGRLAANVLSQLEIPPTVIILGPKHTSAGERFAVAPHARWDFPGGWLSSDVALAQKLAEEIPGLAMDAAAHANEHAIEVELPLLHRLAPQTKVVGIALGPAQWEECQLMANGLARVMAGSGPLLLLISSDMHHFASDAENRRLDERALTAMESRQPQQLLQTVQDERIGMCGVIPAVVVLQALQQQAPLREIRRAGYATSAEVTGDTSRVVGYAGMLIN